MAFFYPQNQLKEPFTGDWTKFDAVKGYMRHFDNYLFLLAISKNPKDFREKQEAEREIKVAQRKLDWWRRHPKFDQTVVTELCDALKKQWGDRI